MEIKVSAKDSEIFDVASFRMSSQNSRIWRGRLMMNLLAVMDESMVSLMFFDNDCNYQNICYFTYRYNAKKAHVSSSLFDELIRK